MSDKRQQISGKSLLLYALGMPFIAFGVVFMLRSNLGNSSWDTLHFNLTEVMNKVLNQEWFTIGWATIVVAVTFTILVIILRRNFIYLLMGVPILLVGQFIDVVNDIILVNFQPETLTLRIISYVIGILALPMGGALLLQSGLPAGVFDEFMFALAKKLKTSRILLIRVIMELTAVLVAFILSLIAGVDLADSKIGIGTIIFALTVGKILKTYLNMFERIGKI